VRVAAIDIGTNSVLLLVAERATPAGDAPDAPDEHEGREGREGREPLSPLVEEATITRLGQGVDRARRLDPEAVARTLACLERYGRRLRELGVDRVDAVGTSAMRDAEGGEAFRARAAALLGVEPRTISGEEEAELTYEGALVGLGARAIDERGAIVVDVGGGSTELVAPAASGLSRVSLDVGAVRMTERHVRSDPPTEAELEAIRADVRSKLAAASHVARAEVSSVVAVAGTATTLLAVAHGVAPYDAARVHGATLEARELAETRARLAALTLDERRRVPGLEPKRADVIVAGAVVLEVVLEELARVDARRAALVISDRGVRWGLAQRLARGAR
jgi:exopolyphosphatase/guanosine-5'-triphosphate,3'-diphosphate pyrophosphatase